MILIHDYNILGWELSSTKVNIQPTQLQCNSAQPLFIPLPNLIMNLVMKMNTDVLYSEKMQSNQILIIL